MGSRYDDLFDKWKDETSETEDEEEEEFNSHKTVFKELPLNKFYAILNNYNNDTDNLQRFCTSYIVTQSLNGVDCFNFCKKFIYKFKNFPSIKKQCTGIEDKEFCNYFNYWLGGQLLRIGAQSYNVSMFIRIFNMLSSQNYIPGCNCKSDKIASSDFKKMKEFFDYAENLEGINNSAEILKNIPGDIYCYYIAKAVNEYNKVISDGSCVEKTCAFNEEMEHFKKKFLSYQSSFRTRCPSNINIPCIQISKKEYDKSCPSGTTVNNPSQAAAHMPDQQEYGTSDNSKTLITTSASAAVGSIFTSLILYKFTPLRDLLGRKKNQNHWNSTHNAIKPFQQYSNNNNMDFGNTTYNVGYQSV
ncbi:unnamed protein product [Plasmodium vivax]|uniref:(malaria parasite P. vivax) hypothetical protein n=1 Tax=Plasmodium vivax TaxID=5855 RepID=A0A8S4HGW2_PLAVI|nr:unnamed protein product [Plasmodium vivax]